MWPTLKEILISKGNMPSLVELNQAQVHSPVYERKALEFEKPIARTHIIKIDDSQSVDN